MEGPTLDQALRSTAEDAQQKKIGNSGRLSRIQEPAPRKSSLNSFPEDQDGNAVLVTKVIS
jgi:hypothetical protein